MPFCPGAVRTSSVAPGGTVLLPLRSTTLTWRKASPPVGSCTKPKPFSGLYHFTVAETGGRPEPLRNGGCSHAAHTRNSPAASNCHHRSLAAEVPENLD